MIDLHAHILFDVDDGPETMYESMRLCEMGVEYGIDRIAATPHLYDPGEIADLMNRQGIAVRAGMHCAPAMHAYLGISGAVRMSLLLGAALLAGVFVLRHYGL